MYIGSIDNLPNTCKRDEDKLGYNRTILQKLSLIPFLPSVLIQMLSFLTKKKKFPLQDKTFNLPLAKSIIFDCNKQGKEAKKPKDKDIWFSIFNCLKTKSKKRVRLASVSFAGSRFSAT